MATTAYATQQSQLYIMNKTVSPAVAVVIAQLQGLDGIGGQASSIKLSNFDSPGYEEYAKGLVDPGKPSGNVVFNYGDTGHQLLQKLLGMGQGSTTSFFYGASDATNAPTVVAGVLTPPKSGVSPSQTWARSGHTFDGFVAEFGISAQVNNVLMAKLSLQASGAVKFVTKGVATSITYG